MFGERWLTSRATLLQRRILKEDKEFYHACAESRVVDSYKALQEVDPDNEQLKLARINVTRRGLFKKEEIEILPGHKEEYFKRYSHEGKDISEVLNSYASDLDKALMDK